MRWIELIEAGQIFMNDAPDIVHICHICLNDQTKRIWVIDETTLTYVVACEQHKNIIPRLSVVNYFRPAW